MQVILTIKIEGAEDKEVTFDKPGEYIMGRFADAAVFVDEVRISKRHCALIIDSEGAKIADLFSANGTIVDDQPLGGDPQGLNRPNIFQPTLHEGSGKAAYSSQIEAELHNGSIIQIGSAKIHVKIAYDSGANPENTKLYRQCKTKLEELDVMLLRIKANNPKDQRVDALLKAVGRLNQWVKLECR